MSRRFTSMQKSKATVVVGLDFGTTFSGFGWALLSEPDRVHKFYEWPDVKEAGGRNYCKTQTSLLYEVGDGSRAYVLKDWAYSALRKHARDVMSVKRKGRVPTTTTQAGTGFDFINRNPGESSNLSSVPGRSHFLTRFKLHLASETETSAAALPNDLTPRRVVSDYLKKLSELIMRVLKESVGSHITMEDVQWCLTVPAIWNEDGKQEMLSCAEIAGLVLGPECMDPYASPHPCIIVLEPEAASVYCLRNPTVHFPVDTGDKFLVVDIGGGTVDLVLHEKIGPPSTVKVREVSPSSGGLCGGTYVDQSFLHFLTKKIPCLPDIVEEHTSSMLSLFGKWEDIKYKFDGNDRFGYDFELPARLARAWEAHDQSKNENDVNSKHPESYDTIEISLLDMHSIFHPVVDRILDLIKERLIPDLKAMLLVGGFAGSRYLVRRIRETYSSKMGNIVVPYDPGSAIFCGAVMYGLYGEDIVSSRIAKKTYGTKICRRYQIGDPKEKLFQDDSGESMCDDVFDIFTRRMEEVPLEHEVTKIYHPTFAKQKSVCVDLYSTLQLNSKYTSDQGVQKEGSFNVPHPTFTELGKIPEISVTLYFGRTTIEVKAVGRNFGDGEKYRMLPVSFERSYQ